MKVPNRLQNDEDLSFQTWKTPSIAPTHLQLKKTVASILWVSGQILYH